MLRTKFASSLPSLLLRYPKLPVSRYARSAISTAATRTATLFLPPAAGGCSPLLRFPEHSRVRCARLLSFDPKNACVLCRSACGPWAAHSNGLPVSILLRYPKTVSRSLRSLHRFDRGHSNSRPFSATGSGWLFSPSTVRCSAAGAFTFHLTHIGLE